MTIHEIPLDKIQHVIEALRPHVPTCIPLYRRLQFSHFTTTSHLLSSVSLEDLLQRQSINSTNSHSEAKEEPWLVAYVDRSKRPETEVWTYGSWENDEINNSDKEDTDDGSDAMEKAQRLIRALVAEVRGIGLPTDTSTTTPLASAAGQVQKQSLSRDSATNVQRGEYEGHLSNPNIVLFGALHERTVRLMGQLGILSREFVGAEIPYRKYFFDVGQIKSRAAALALPTGLHWGPVQSSHYALVRSRTAIPRQDVTLRQLPSLAIFPADGHDPVAWSFLGPDASLSSLHVEPEYRGKGLAKLLADKLFVDETAFFSGEQGTDADRWAHADVANDNVPSNGVCKALGGQWSFHVYWVRIDVG